MRLKYRNSAKHYNKQAIKRKTQPNFERMKNNIITKITVTK